MIHNVQALRDRALDIFKRGVRRADPFKAVEVALTDHPPDRGVDLIIGVGKAARGMTEAALPFVAPGTRAIVVTNYENEAPLSGAEVYGAGHPVPDHNGAHAADVVCKALGQAKGGVLALISGGGSALLPAPVEGLTLNDEATVNKLLLASGADISQMNLVRQQLSRLKGGGMLRLADAPVQALILSDVVGDDLRVIASGPTVAPLGTSTDACNALKALEVWSDCPVNVQSYLSEERPEAKLREARNILVGSNAMSVKAMAEAASGAHVAPWSLEGDVADAANRLVSWADKPGLYVFGGETTVRLTGMGRGGRNQELALRVAQAAKVAGWRPFVYLQGGSDGRDGPTDAAGGLVDDGTLDRIAAAGLDLDAILAENDSYRALESAGDLLVTGATGTNVADLGVLIRT